MSGSGQVPVCSADQKWVYYKEPRGNHIYGVGLDGSGQPEAVFAAPQGLQCDEMLWLLAALD
jgi:hypothetical protein